MCAVEGLNEKYEAGNEKSESTSDVKIQFLLYHVRFKQRGEKSGDRACERREAQS